MLNLFLWVIVAVRFFADYKKDGRKFVKQKILHFLIIVLLMIFYSESVGQIFYIIGNFSDFMDYNYMAMGGLPKEAVLVSSLLGVLVRAAFFIVLIGMTARGIAARPRFMKLLIVLIPFEAISVHFVLFVEFENILYGFVIGLITMTIILGGIYRIYGTNFMKEFFEIKVSKEAGLNDEVILDDIDFSEDQSNLID